MIESPCNSPPSNWFVWVVTHEKHTVSSRELHQSIILLLKAGMNSMEIMIPPQAMSVCWFKFPFFFFCLPVFIVKSGGFAFSSYFV